MPHGKGLVVLAAVAVVEEWDIKQTRKKHSPAFKAKVALADLQGEETIAQLSRSMRRAPVNYSL